MKRQIYTHKSTERTLTYTANKVASLKINDEKRTTVRVYDGGFIGVAGKSGSADIDQLEKKAVAMLDNKVPYPEPQDKAEKLSIDTGTENQDKSDLLQEGEKLIKKISEENPEFIFSGKTVFADTTDIFCSDGGTEYDCSQSSQMTYFLMKHKDSASIFDDAYSAEGRIFETDKIAEDVNLLAKAYLKKLPAIEEDEIAVIADISSVYYIMSSFNAQAYATGSSLLNGKLGKKVFSDKFTLYCEQDPRKQAGAVFFDGEGIINDGYKAYLVRDGVMQNLLTTRQTAEKYGYKNIGTADAPFAAIPQEGTPGIDVAYTAEDLNELLRGEKAVLLSSVSGGDMTTAGDIALPVLNPYLYEDGELKGRMPGFTVTANIFDVLGKDYIGACGKGIWAAGKNTYLVFRAKLVNKQ